MTAAYSASSARDRHTAHSLLGEAEDTIHRASSGGRLTLYTVDATAAQVDLYRIGVATALGTPDEGVAYARRIDPARLPTNERRARYWTDTARMWHALGDDKRTFGALRAIEMAAPEEARRPAIQSLTELLLFAPASNLPGLKDFAHRTGVSPV